MNSSTIIAAAAVGACAGTSLAALSATPTTEGAYLAANPSAATENFDALPTGNLPYNATSTLGLVSITANGASGFAGDFALEDFGTGDVLVEMFVDPGNIPSFTMDFGEPVTSFAAGFGALGAPGSSMVVDIDGMTVELGTIINVGGYVEFSTGAPFQTVTFGGPNVDFFSMDDVSFTPVPAPASLALVGLGGLAATRRRR